MTKVATALVSIFFGAMIIFLALASRHAKVTKQAFLTIDNMVGTLPLFSVVVLLFSLVTIGIILGEQKDHSDEHENNDSE